MTGAAGLGPWPGVAAVEAQVAVLDLLADVPTGVEGLPHLVQLPARGPAAASVGRTLGLLEGMPAGLEPHGWRLRSTADAELRRARAWLRGDLEALAAAAAGYAGPLVLPVLGPWSLAARVWLPRGERLLGDPVAVRDVVDSLVVGVGEHVGEVRRQVPGAEPVLLVVEPVLADVLDGAVPTFSGRGRLAAVPASEVREALRRTVAGLAAAVADDAVVLHVPAELASVRVAADAGAAAVGVDVTGADQTLWEGLAAVVERGVRAWLGAVPATHVVPGRSAAAAALRRAWRDVGLERARLDRVVLTPAGGLAHLTPARAVEVLRTVVDAAQDLTSDAA